MLALEEGRLQRAVYNNYLKCRREAAAFENTDRWKQIHKEVRRFYKNSPKYNQ
jgi:hypothetical protein